jgi:hypothetical protein
MDRITTIPVISTAQPTQIPVWHFPTEQEYEIANLAARCQLKQQQREPLDVVVREEEAEHDIDDDLSTSFPTQLTTDGTKQLKMAFLDRLAELVCRKKLASYVTCTSMTEHEDQVTIVIARNATWKDTDRKFLNTLACLMESISSKGLLFVDVCYSRCVSYCNHRALPRKLHIRALRAVCQLLYR